MKSLFKYIFLMFLIPLFAACGGGGGSAGVPGGSLNPTAFSVNAPNTLTLAVGQSVSYQVSGGKSPYLSVTDTPSVSTAVVDGSTLTVGGFSVGEASITVTPTGGGASKVIALTVIPNTRPLQLQAPGTIDMLPGNVASYVVLGGTPPYRVVSSNANVVIATAVSGEIRLQALDAGDASIQVFDSSGDAEPITRAVKVTSTSLFTTAPATLTMTPGVANTRSFTISGGVAPYSAQSSNSMVATGSVAGTSLSVVPVADGAASVVVMDAKGAQVTIAVTVASGTPSDLFTTAPSALTMSPNSTRMFTIGGGVAPYQAISSNLQVVSNADVSGAILTLTTPAGATGTATVFVTDSTGRSVSLSLSVSSAALPLSLSSDAITIPVNLPEGALIRIIGGAAPFTVTSGIPAALGAVIRPTTVAGVTTYEVVITPKLVSEVDVTVVDSAGQSAKVKITTNAGATGIRLAPSALTISERLTNQSIELGVSGAIGTFRVFTSDIRRTTVSANQTAKTVTVTTSDAVNLDVPTADGVALITITVVDSVNNVATSVLTVKDNP